jgi:Ni,Fe-hydrogenase III large subunit
MIAPREMTVAVEDINNVVAANVSIGFGIACMYVRNDAGGQRTLEVIMVSKDEALRLSAHLLERSYLSLAQAFPAANKYEREILEKDNIIPLGHPDLTQLRSKLMTDGCPADASGGVRQRPRRIPIPRNEMQGIGLFEIPVGPIHAGVIEPGHFRFSVAGESIQMLRVHLGYAHRGVERMLEGPVDKDNTRLVERISGDNAIAHSLAYLQAIEGGAEIPMRAKYVRTVYAELERIYYSLNGIAGIAMDTSLTVPAMKAYALKENILRLNEKVTGHRMLMGALRPGGVRKDLSEDSSAAIEKEMLYLKYEVERLFDVLLSTPSFMDRTETTGTLTHNDAVKLRIVGQAARASGVEYDVRNDHPYAAYGVVGLKVQTHTAGDVHARLKMKKRETLESINIIMQCLNNMEAGEICRSIETKDGFHMGMVESPRGEVMHCIHVDGGNIVKYKIRNASYPNWQALELAVHGNIVPDFPLINKSFDLSYSGNDL